jgi:CubicO group peptidase (beta-lactamase class C family)
VRYPFRSAASGAFVLLALLGWAGSAAAATRWPPADTVRNPPARNIGNRAELEAFLDGVIATELRDQHIAGATVAVVKDDSVLLVKGYGYADVDTHEPVDGERSLFRIASITKLFTWTAVMQLVEQGKLDLDVDVNTYLDFKIPATYPQPITLRHLLTHTAGFEEDNRDFATADPAQIRTMKEWLPKHIPARVQPPGKLSSYSNFGAALGGYIVERASGTPWEEYVERRILVPLGMTRTTARQPLPEQFQRDMAKGYHWRNGRFVAGPWQIATGAAPIGAISATAADMAKFMLAHLNYGRLGTTRILGESTSRLMQARAFSHDPRVAGMALGFYEQNANGLRIVGHGGDIATFHSDLVLIPAERLGIFVSYNTDTGAEVSFRPFLRTVLDHYFPVQRPVLTPPADFARRGARFTGIYQFNRHSETTFQKALGLTNGLAVEAGANGTLTLQSPLGTMQLIEVEPLLFEDVLTGERVAFREDSVTKRITHAFIGFVPVMALERMAWWASPPLHRRIWGVAVVLFVAVIVAAVARAIRTKRQGAVVPPSATVGWRLLVGVAGVQLGFLVLLAVVLSWGGDLFSAGANIVPMRILKVALGLPVVGAVLTAGAAIAAGVRWRSKTGTVTRQWGYTLAVLVCVLFLWSLHQWNLLGWRM